jgi:CelD/BcsL family acetyltransferase involved in cellulose biosynthesis
MSFRLALIRIGSAKFRAIKPDVHPFKLPAHPDFDALPLDAFNSGIEVIILNSHPIQKPMKRLSMQHGALCYFPLTYRRFYIDLSGTFEEYLDKLTSNERTHLRRKVRRFKEDGVEFQVFRSAEELLRFHSLAQQVSRKTWQENLLKTGLPDTPAFEAELRSRGEQDTARAFLLLKGGIPIAYLCTFAKDDVLISRSLGYDLEFRHASPGAVLQYLALEFLFAEQKFAMFDFSEGEGQHKQTFATHSIDCADVLLFAPTARAKALVRADLMINASVRAVLRITERAGLKERLKRLVKTWSAK